MDHSIDNYLKERIYLEDIPGLCVSVKKEKNVFKKAYGYSDYLNRIPLTLNDSFHCCSITKLITAMAAMEFDTSKSVKKILPWIDLSPAITMDMLISHTSGIGRITEYGWNSCSASDTALKDYLKAIELPIWSKPGERYIYSDLGYDILGQCVTVLSGRAFDEYVHDNILDTIGMTYSSFRHFSKIQGYALPHVKDKKNRVVRSESYPYAREHVPSSCMEAPLGDLEKLATYCLNRAEQFLEKVIEIPDTGDYSGRGCTILKRNGRTYFGHDGADTGFKVSLWMCPEENIYISLLSNASYVPLRKITRKIMDII